MSISKIGVDLQCILERLDGLVGPTRLEQCIPEIVVGQPFNIPEEVAPGLSDIMKAAIGKAADIVLGKCVLDQEISEACNQK